MKCGVNAVRFSLIQSLYQLGRRGNMTDNSAEIPFQSFLRETIVSSHDHGQGRPLFDVVSREYPLPTTALPTLQGVSKDGFGEAGLVFDMPESCEFPSLDSCLKRFL